MYNKTINKIFFIFCFSFLFSQCQDYDFGDANDDNSLDIIDVVIYVDIVFNDSQLDIVNYDLNFDSLINIFDIIILVERILDEFPYSLDVIDINFNFDSLFIDWETTSDHGFIQYNIYYSNFIDNEEIIIQSIYDINESSAEIQNISLNEQNFFWIGVVDFMGCEILGSQYIYELPYKNYQLNDNGEITHTDFSINDFKSAQECASCHEDHYNEWFSSMHSYTMRSPIFFSYKEKTAESHPATGDNFCMQCHNPVSFLTGNDLTNFTTVNELQNSDIDQVLKEGITCDVCHTATGISQTVYASDDISANAEYKLYPLGNIKFGPIQNPEPNDFHDSYYLPTYSTSQMCLPCHDLVVRDVEAEITFTEWNRIPGFSMFGGVSCQQCHMPLKDNGYHDHRFIGVGMDFSIPPESNPLYQDVQNLLSEAAQIEFNVLGDVLPTQIAAGDSLSIPLAVESLTAHSIPSGTSFNREAWIELTVYENDTIIFSSGLIEYDEPLDTADSNLLYFTSYLFDENGNFVDNITEMHSMQNLSLLAYQERFHYYNILVPENTDGTLLVKARLLFRPLKPSFINSHHPEFLENIPIIEIDSIEHMLNFE